MFSAQGFIVFNLNDTNHCFVFFCFWILMPSVMNNLAAFSTSVNSPAQRFMKVDLTMTEWRKQCV